MVFVVIGVRVGPHGAHDIKERAVALTAPASVKPGRYTPGDDVLAFLESLG